MEIKKGHTLVYSIELIRVASDKNKAWPKYKYLIIDGKKVRFEFESTSYASSYFVVAKYKREITY